MRRREQNGEGWDHGENRKQEETQSVDDHGREFPVVALVRHFVVFPHFLGKKTQLLQDFSKYGRLPRGPGYGIRLEAAPGSPVHQVRGHVRRVVVCRGLEIGICHRVVFPFHGGGIMVICGAVGSPDVVLKVKDVRQQTARGPLSELHFAHPGISQQFPTCYVLARTTHTQDPGQPFTDPFLYLRKYYNDWNEIFVSNQSGHGIPNSGVNHKQYATKYSTKYINQIYFFHFSKFIGML